MFRERQEEELNSAEEQPVAPVSGEPAPAEETTPDEDLSQKVAVQTRELQELQDRYLRLAAEFDNYRKRTVRERTDFIRTAHEGLLFELLPVLDNLARALAAARSSAASSGGGEALIEGVDITLRLFKGMLEKQGLREIETVGREFDPTIHDAVEQVRTADHPENTVVEEVLPGYLLDQKVLRPAQVKVSTGAAAPAEPEGQPGVKGGE